MTLLDRILNKNKGNSNNLNGQYLVSTDRELPEKCRTEALFWKAKYFEAIQNHRNTNKGLMRLAHFKYKHKDVGKACKKAYEHGAQSVKQLCEIYFDIASEIYGEKRVREMRAAKIEELLQEKEKEKQKENK